MSDPSERPLWIPARDGVLFGVLTQPETPIGRSVLLLAGGGDQLALHRNRWNVRVARSLAGRGFHVLRMDFHGMGDSAGFVPRLDLRELFDEDVKCALDSLSQMGVPRCTLVGMCFGARAALLAGAASDHVDGLVLLSPPLRDFRFGDRVATRRSNHDAGIAKYAKLALRPEVLRGLKDPHLRRRYAQFAKRKITTAWRRSRSGKMAASTADFDGDASRTFLEPLQIVAERGVPTVLVFGEQEDYYEEFLRHRARIDEIIADPRGRVELVTRPGVVHGLVEMKTQDQMHDLVIDWIERHAPEGPDGTQPTLTGGQGRGQP